MIGSVIDKYEVLQKLGEGATATVYRGRHIAIGKDVAIKVLHPHLSASSRNRERFNREARAVGRLSHQNIVSILDYSGSQADDCYIVTELVEGVTALDLLRTHGQLPSEFAAILGIELCRALGFAHAEGVIHRDIKPENVMIRRDGTVKLMDFGVARVLDEGSITIDGSLLGSPAYMSPQQALDQPLDGRSDLFSLGTLLFHLVTGHVPFAGSNASIILRNIIDGNRPEVLELAPTASPSLAAAIDRLLQQKAEDRFPTAADAEAALTASLAEVGLAGEHAAINLQNLLLSPDAALKALDDHLRAVLLDLGKQRLAAKDPLAALQLFNRLLAIDEDNAEVVALIQSLHQAPVAPRRPRWLAPLAAGLVLAASGAAWWLARDPVADPPAVVPPPPPVASVTTPPPAPEPVALAAPEPTPPAPATPVVAAPSTPRPAEPERGLPRAVPAVASPVVTSTPPPPAEPRGPATVRVSLKGSRWADVFLDGKLIGRWGEGPSSAWVGSRQNPLEVPEGSHVVKLVNPFSEPRELPIVVTGGEVVDLGVVELRRLPVHFTVNSQMPRDCTLTVGGVRYGLVEHSANFELREPEPDTPVVFDCPTLGRLAYTVGATRGGEDVFIPTSVPSP